MHELALHGFAKVTLDTLARMITPRTELHVKLHRNRPLRVQARSVLFATEKIAVNVHWTGGEAIFA